MSTFAFNRYALTVSAAAALLAGCGVLRQAQDDTQVPIGAPGAMPLGYAPHEASPLSRFTSSDDEVQYLAEDEPAGMAEFNYPEGDSPLNHWGLKQHGPYPVAACTPGAKIFWIVLLHKADEIVEYGVGSEKPIKTLAVTGGEPSDCTVDPTTGDLAVPLANTSSIVIFTKGSGSGQVVADQLDHSVSSTYDAQGNLFVDGYSDNKNALSELPRKSTQFKKLSFSNKLTVDLWGDLRLRWDGTYLAMYYFNNGIDAIYRYRINGSKAKLVGTVNLGGVNICGQFWVWSQAGLLFCADSDEPYVDVWDYPAGGSPIAHLGPARVGSIVSVKP
jgi:hypothetical protein